MIRGRLRADTVEKVSAKEMWNWILNKRIQGNGFLNQDCALAPDLESTLLRDSCKFLFRQYRPLPDIGSAQRLRHGRLTMYPRKTIFWEVDTTCRLHPSGYGERIAAFHSLCPNEGSATQALAPPVSFKQRIKICATSAMPKLWQVHCVRRSPPRVSRSPSAKASN